MVERVTGATLIARLRRRRAAAVNRRFIELIQAHPGLFKTITVESGPEFHGYEEIERATGVTIYFATPYASWERGANENTNGLIRQYIPKRTSMKRLTQDRCDTIARALNNRPRKHHGFRTPLDRSPITSLSRRALTFSADRQGASRLLRFAPALRVTVRFSANQKAVDSSTP